MSEYIPTTMNRAIVVNALVGRYELCILSAGNAVFTPPDPEDSDPDDSGPAWLRGAKEIVELAFDLGITDPFEDAISKLGMAVGRESKNAYEQAVKRGIVK